MIKSSKSTSDSDIYRRINYETRAFRELGPPPRQMRCRSEESKSNLVLCIVPYYGKHHALRWAVCNEGSVDHTVLPVTVQLWKESNT